MPKLTLHEIYLAQQRIEPYITRTPLVRSSLLSAQLGCDVWLKLENRQHHRIIQAARRVEQDPVAERRGT